MAGMWKSLFQNQSRKSPAQSRWGITLIELMIAVALTTIILGAMIAVFRFSSQEISKGRATLEMASQLRIAAELMRSDLENVTVPLRPWATDSNANGYFEYVEGPDSDRYEFITNDAGVADVVDVGASMSDSRVNGASYLGDHDDILAMTIRSKSRPFKGRFNGATIESYVAEVVWWTVREDAARAVDIDGEVDFVDHIKLYRRLLLVRPDLSTAETNIADFYDNNDVSVRPRGGALVTNSLGDLAKRENRFAHDAGTFPHAFMRNVINVRPLTGEFQGTDIMLTNVAAFDIKVFSPNALVNEFIDQVVDSNDPGFDSTVGSNEGAYVDLGFNMNPANSAMELFASNAWFAGNPDINSQMDAFIGNVGSGNLGRTWCTWSPHYEYDGINQELTTVNSLPTDTIVDQATDGIDNNNRFGPDDDSERETKPPYPYKIRSIQIAIRMIDKNSGQSRQMTVRHSGVPE